MLSSFSCSLTLTMGAADFSEIQYCFIIWHSVASQKNCIFSSTTVRTSNLEVLHVIWWCVFLHILKMCGFRRKLIFTSKMKRVTRTIVVVKVCLVMVLSMLEKLGGGRFETKRVRILLGNMKFLVTVFKAGYDWDIDYLWR